MANTYYENFVLQNKLTDILNTKLNVKSLMTIDSDLTESAGMKKTIHKYTYSGTVETVAEGDGNTTTGEITYTPVEYEVEVAQQRFSYTDEAFMKNPIVVDGSMEGAATTMVNDMNTKFFAQLAEATLEQAYSTFDYDVIVDAISQMNLEDENGLFLIIGTDMKATIRKDEDFKSKELGKIITSGQIGTISGVPVIVSKLVPANVTYLATSEAVTLFTKKESEVAQEREENTRTNTVYLRKVNLVALTDATKLVAILPYITAPVITTESLTAGDDVAFAGTCVSGATVTVYKNGTALATATVNSTSWTYTIATAAEGEVYSVVASKANYAAKASATSLTVQAAG